MRQVDVLGGLEGVLVELPEWQLLCRRGADHHAERSGGEQAESDAVHGEGSLFRRHCIPSSLYERSLATRSRSSTEERSVGKRCINTVIIRWTTYHEKKK